MGTFDFITGDELTSIIAENYPQSTEQERRIAARYTAIRFVVVGGGESPDAHTVWLIIGNQQFRLNGYCDTKSEAAFLAWMLAKALCRVEAETRDED